jgi:glutathione S-transferase
MLELYHYEPTANSAKPLICLKEKGLEFTSHYIDLHNFQQHSPEYVAINPNGQVPALRHDGNIITESTVINEYLDEVFPDVPLKPDTALGRAHMRIWTKFVDEYFCPSLSLIGWHFMIKNIVKDLTEEEFEAKIARIPLKEQQDKWRLAAKQAFPEEQLADARRKCGESVKRMERTLAQSPWLAGETFSLADIACFPMANGMPRLMPEFMNDKETPRSLDWLQRMNSRPGVKAALAMSRRPAVVARAPQAAAQ